MKRAIFVLLASLWLPSQPPAALATTVEEVLAVVDNTPVLKSDLLLAETVRLVPLQRDAEPEVYGSHLLDRRIQLELQYRDLESSGILSRLELDPEIALQNLIDRGGGQEQLRSKLAALGLRWSDLSSLSLRIAAVNAYVEQRLRPRVTVSLEEVEAAYRSELAGLEAETESNQAPPSLAELSEQLHRLLLERKLNAEIATWLEEAEQRHELTRFVR